MFDGISPFHLSVPCAVFGEDPDRIGVPRYDVVVCAEKPGSVPTLSGFSIEILHNLATLETANTVIVPAWFDPNERPS